MRFSILFPLRPTLRIDLANKLDGILVQNNIPRYIEFAFDDLLNE